MSEFETVICSRCGGTGHYSYCQMYGTTCFKCSGRGKVFTTRGAIANQRYQDALCVTAEAVKVGDKLMIEAMPGGWRGGWLTVEAITEEENGRIRLTGQFHGQSHAIGFGRGHKVRIAQTKEFKAAAKEAALEYQATLTKAGTVRKAKRGPEVAV